MSRARSISPLFVAALAVACGGSTANEGDLPPGDCATAGTCPPGAVDIDAGLGPDGAPLDPGALSVTVTPAVVGVQAGESVDVAVQVVRPAGLHDALSVDVSPLPASVTALTAPIPIDATASSFRLNVGAAAIPGNYPIGVTVRGTSVTATANLALTVTGAPGALDASFGNQGKASTPVAMRSLNLGLQSSGRIVLLGSDPQVHAFVAAAFDASGTADASFGTAGRAALPIGTRAITDAIVLSTGMLVAAGATPPPSTMWVGRIDAAGAPDAKFGNNGLLPITSSGVSEIGSALVEASDHGVFLAGHRAPDYFDPTTNAPLVVHVTAAGALDTTFGSSGRATLPGAQCTSVIADPQWRVVCAGSVVHSGGGFDLFVGRLSTTGVLDTTFAAPTGWLRGSAGPNASMTIASAMQPDGKIVVVSRVASSSGGDLVVTRFDAAGLLDGGFAQSGKLALDLGTNESLTRIAFDSKGRILLVGASGTTSASRALVVRLSPSGVLDATFGADHSGIVRLPSSTLGDFATGVVVLPDDRLLVGGHSSVSLATRVAWVARIFG